ncbi:MAG: glycosyltransferase family 2 protein [Kiritimatiellae bacterium]|nr:glycosyltransferase family 2 protein [Kiritimatiellia bacterium]
MRKDDALVSFVVPFLNEKDNLPVLTDRIGKVLAGGSARWELLLVDDGSSDGSTDWVREHAGIIPGSGGRGVIRLVRLSRNFGHQIAITAGLDRARGDAVVIMDADLQDPPEVIPDLLDKWREGVDVVYAVRRSRQGETWLKKTLAAGFYRIFHALAKVNVPMDAGDFRLVDRCIVDALRQMRELHRFMRGLTCWVGWKQAAVYYDRAPRLAGETKYPVWKSARLAFDAITSFSAAPLRWIVGLGGIMMVVSVLWGLWVWITVALGGGKNLQPGWASLMVGLVFLSGVQLLCLGMLGQYVSRIFEEGKHRPLYFVAEDSGASSAPETPGL